MKAVVGVLISWSNSPSPSFIHSHPSLSSSSSSRDTLTGLQCLPLLTSTGKCHQQTDGKIRQDLDFCLFVVYVSFSFFANPQSIILSWEAAICVVTLTSVVQIEFQLHTF